MKKKNKKNTRKNNQSNFKSVSFENSRGDGKIDQRFGRLGRDIALYSTREKLRDDINKEDFKKSS